MAHRVRLSNPVPLFFEMSNVGLECLSFVRLPPRPLFSLCSVVHRRGPVHGNARRTNDGTDWMNPVFRLLPGPPHRISLYEPLHQGHPLIRPAEDTEEQARERADRIAATGVVVELGDLLNDKSAHWPTVSHFWGGIFVLRRTDC